MGPHEASALQALRKQTQPVAAPPQDLYPVSRTAPEHEQMAAVGILGELGLA